MISRRARTPLRRAETADSVARGGQTDGRDRTVGSGEWVIAVFGERTKRAAKIVESAQQLLDPGDEVQEVVQVQTGRTAGANAGAVEWAVYGMPLLDRGVHSLAILATDETIYVVTLTGARLLNVGEIVFKEPIDDAEISFEDMVIMFNGHRLHVMGNWGQHVKRLQAHVAAE
jgi:hypothetical protein